MDVTGFRKSLKRTGKKDAIIGEMVRAVTLAEAALAPSGWEAVTPAALIQVVSDYISRTSFDGIATLPKEAESTIQTARSLPRIVEY